METLPQNLPNVLKLLQGLPDDLLKEIYTKYLRRYRIDKDGNLIRLIDFEKYKFLENVISRKMVGVSKVKKHHEYSLIESTTNILEIQYMIPNAYELPDRKEQSIKDDMMYVYLEIKEDTIRYAIQKYRLIKIEEFLTKDKPISMYIQVCTLTRGNYRDYAWEIFTILSDGSNQYV